MVLTELADSFLAAAEQFKVLKRSVLDFALDSAERAVVVGLSGISATLRKKLKSQTTTKTATFMVTDAANVLTAVAKSLLDGEPLQRLKLLFIGKKLVDCLAVSVTPAAPAKTKPRKSKPTNKIYQLKISLLDIKPPIWRRIQVKDCTLDKFHEHIQTAMGWTNSHLHQFEIQGECYGDPELLDDGFDDFEGIDSRRINLSQLLPQTDKRFAFKYKYDFGDGWEHEILFEGSPSSNPKVKYPVCLKGKRACPPEDCGGVWGYGDFLVAISNPQHEEHDRLLEWGGGPFDPEAFDADEATADMQQGLPDWRET